MSYSSVITNKYRIFRYRDSKGNITRDNIEIKINNDDTLEIVKSKLIKKLEQLFIDTPTNTQDILLVSQDGIVITSDDQLKRATYPIVFTIAESLDGGRRRSSSARKSSAKNRNSRRKFRSAKKRATRRYRHRRRA
jgi:hypothetical protein